MRLHLEEGRQRVGEQRQADEQDAPQAEAGHDGPVDRARRPLHDVDLMRLERDDEAQRDGGHHIDPEHLRRGDRQGEAEQDRHRDDQSLRDIGRQQEQHGLFDIVVDGPAFLHRRADRGEIVVGQDHAGGLFRHLGSLDAHGDADVGLLQRGRVVHAVAGHRHDLVVGLDRLDEPKLVLRAGAGEDVDVADAILQRRIVHGLDLHPGDGGLAVADAEHFGDGRGGDLVVAGDHGDADAAAVAFLHRLDRLLARRIHQADKAEQDQRSAAGRRARGFRPRGRDFRARRDPARARPARRGGRIRRAKRSRSSGAAAPSANCWRSQWSRITSGAPLTRKISLPSPERCRVAMNLCSDSNGMASMRGNFASSACRSMPSLVAKG